MKTITKEIQDNEVLIAFAVPEAETPALINAICSNNGYSDKMPNPDFLGNVAESETNPRFIANTQTPKDFALNWVMTTSYQQLFMYNERVARETYEKARQEARDGLVVTAKPI